MSVRPATVAGMDMMPLITLAVGLLLGAALGWAWARSRSASAGAAAATRALEGRAADSAVVRESLDRLHDHLRDLDHARVSWQGQLRQQVDDVRRSTEALRKETTGLSTALRKPHVRGRWGELHLRRAVEIAGLVDRCDFSEQVHVAGEDSNRRPDLVVHLAGGKSIAVDAKAPLEAFLDLACADDEQQRQDLLARHARQLRSHADALGAKTYWRAFEAAPEFVVMFLPSEAILSAALDAEPDLIEHAASRQVVLATPTTLIALLRTVAYAWTQETLAERARDIHLLGRDLHDRLGVMGAHLDKLGRSLSAAVAAYNQTVGSLESRVLVTARRFHDYAVGTELDSPRPVTESTRPLGAPELLDQRRGA